MMIFEEPNKNEGTHSKKFKLLIRASELLVVLVAITSFGLVLWHRAEVASSGKDNQSTHPIVYVPPGTPTNGTGLLQGSLSLDNKPVVKSGVVIYNSDGSVASRLETDNSGYFQTNLASGYYTLQVRVAGLTHNRIVTIVNNSVDIEDINL